MCGNTKKNTKNLDDLTFSFPSLGKNLPGMTNCVIILSGGEWELNLNIECVISTSRFDLNCFWRDQSETNSK